MSLVEEGHALIELGADPERVLDPLLRDFRSKVFHQRLRRCGANGLVLATFVVAGREMVKHPPQPDAVAGIVSALAALA